MTAGALNPQRAVAVAVGGALGAGVRWALGDLLPATDFPWAVLVVNTLGTALLGWAVARASTVDRGRRLLRDALGPGFCGGLTTFSAFAVDAAQLSRDGETVLAAAFVVVTVAVGLGAAAVTSLGARAPGMERA